MLKMTPVDPIRCSS